MSVKPEYPGRTEPITNGPHLPKTERSNPLTREIDTWPISKILEVMNQEDHRIAPAVGRELPNIIKATRLVVESLSKDGRLIYAGAGTSARIAVTDGSELYPTFGFPNQRIITLISGGPEALFRAIEGAEDSEDKGKEAFLAQNPTSNDVVIGVASSGRTPFVAGVLKEARARDIPCIAVVGDDTGTLSDIAQVVISPDVGPEVITGSTRLKNGTAQKMVLNMISTAAMICLGRTYSNLMAGTYQANRKLSQRARRILMDATGRSLSEVEKALEDADGDLPLALVMLFSGLPSKEAQDVLTRNKGSIRKAIQEATSLSSARGSSPEPLADSPHAVVELNAPFPSAPSQNAISSRVYPEPSGKSASSYAGLKPGSPEDADLNPFCVEKAFEAVKDMVGDGEGPLPGAVAAIVRHGVLIGPRAYGWAVRTPARIAATPNTIFDVASLTKVTATLPSVLSLIDQGKVRLDDSLSLFIPEFGSKGKERITIGHLLTHTSGLPAHIKFWEKGLRGQDIISYLCDLDLSEERDKGTRVLYSDLGFILLGELVRRVTGLSIKDYSEANVFKPLLMNDTFFVPKGSLRYRIAATEYRQDMDRVMWGEVHDENAYALGGIAGHAGLFSTTFDMARYCQMWLRNGTLDGKTILSSPMVSRAISESVDAEERRGLGWMLKSESFSSGGDLLSEKAFGHTGFTGTSIWMDPEKDLAVVLLTNRVHAGRDSNVVIRLRPLFANACAAAVID